MASIAELLKYKDELVITHPSTGKVLWKGWIKVLGDESIKEAYKYSRIVSAQKRATLRDKDSVEYKDEVESIAEQDKQDLLDLIMASQENDFTRESVAAVIREELPKIEEIAEEPDAPSLEEQELLDKEELNTQEEFLKAIDDYVSRRKEELKGRLDKMTHKQLIAMAQEELLKVAPMQAFLSELNDQRGYRSTFIDKECKTRAFKSIEEYKDAHSTIKSQIIEAYNKLEMGPDDIKN